MGEKKDPLLEAVADFIQEGKLILPGDHVLAGVSGGADSVCLLLLLHELADRLSFTLSVVHVDHGIRGAASREDAAFVQALCDRLSVPCRLAYADVPAYAAQKGLGLEEAGRILRYQIFSRDLGPHVRIAVAHHREDNAETMLLALARGTGLSGLAGIPPVRGPIIRPLLTTSKAEILAWLRARGQNWRTDESNADTGYRRNRIRAEVMPAMEAVNTEAAWHMQQTAFLLRQTLSYLDQEADRARTSCLALADGEGTRLLLSGLLALHPVLREHFLLRILQETAGSSKDISRIHVSLLADLCNRPVGKRLCLPYGLVAERGYDDILLKKNGGKDGDRADEDCFLQRPAIPGITGLWNGMVLHAEILDFDGDLQKIPRKLYTKWLDYDKINADLQIRARRPGDFLQIHHSGGRQTIQDYLVNQKIPANRRDVLPLLAEGSHILWVIGGRISEAYRVSEQTRQVLALSVERPEPSGTGFEVSG